MSFRAIVSQGHISEFDPQGKLHASQKRAIFDLSIEHLRKYNPDAYIAVVGHGVVKPTTADLCDYFHWEPLRPMTANGFVKGMPAQFKFVSKGISHIRDKGFTHLVKTRTDCVIGQPSICDICHKWTQAENKPLLLTQQTGWMDYKMGDCLMFGEMDLLHDIWHADNPVYVSNWGDGLTNTGMHFVRHFTGRKPPPFERSRQLHEGMTWEGLLKRYVSFRNVNTLKFTCLRRNYHQLVKLGWEKVKEQIMSNEFNFDKYHWGRATGWCRFDSEGRLVKNARPYYYSEKTFYQDRDMLLL